LSKVERGERPVSIDYLIHLTEILKLGVTEIQTIFIADKISKDFAGLEHLSDGLKAAENKLNQKKK
jgi:hypothetical protein